MLGAQRVTRAGMPDRGRSGGPGVHIWVRPEGLIRRGGAARLQVGAIIGKGGEVISQLKSVIGVKIRISDRDDFVPGTRNRKVTISGAADAVQIAQVRPCADDDCPPCMHGGSAAPAMHRCPSQCPVGRVDLPPCQSVLPCCGRR